MIEISNVFNAQLAEQELFVLFLPPFVLKKEKRRMHGATRGKSLRLPLAQKRKRKRKDR